MITRDPTHSRLVTKGPHSNATYFTDDEYKVTVTSITGNTFSIKRNSIGTTDLTCTTPATGGCPTGGIWG